MNHVLIFLKSLYLLLSQCVCIVHVCYGTCVEVRGILGSTYLSWSIKLTSIFVFIPVWRLVTLMVISAGLSTTKRSQHSKMCDLADQALVGPCAFVVLGLSALDLTLNFSTPFRCFWISFTSLTFDISARLVPDEPAQTSQDVRQLP